MKSKMTNIVVLLSMIIFSFGMGCVTEQTKITDLRYNFHTGDEFNYEVESVNKIADNLEDGGAVCQWCCCVNQK